MTEYRTVSIGTLGCRVNQYESEAITEQLTSRGLSVRGLSQKSDLYIINTCTVTAESDRKSRQMIRRAARDGAPVIVCGCYAQNDPKAVAALPGVAFVIGNGNKVSAVTEAAERLMKGERPDKAVILSRSFSLNTYEPCSIGAFRRTRAYIKIQDGCSGRCAYCTIPAARGLPRSRPMEDVVDEVRRLTEAGCREIVLTGIETSDYEFGLPALLERLDEVESLHTLRFGSLEPSSLTPDFAAALKASKKAAPHLHLSVQSGCSRTLAAMRRRYNAEMLERNMERLKRAVPGIRFTADMIVGFPGETEEDFEETLAFARRAGFLHLHIFPYSKRPGTEAATLPDQIPETVKSERLERLAAVCRESRAAILNETVSAAEPIEVLAETVKDGFITGHTPDFLEVKIPAPPRALSLRGQFLSARPRSTDGIVLFADLI